MLFFVLLTLDMRLLFCCALQVDRQDHFAPVKNAPGSAADSPDTARAALLSQGAGWVVVAGGKLADGVQGVEVSPLLSYAGEGLQERVAGKVVGQAGQQAVQLNPASSSSTS